jgi:hypothetical protein
MAPTLIGSLLSLAVWLAPPQEGDPVAAWTEDVLHLVAELERLHPDPFFGCPQAEFEAAVDAFLARIEEDGAQSATVELMRLMALLSSRGRDGHAVVWPTRARLLPLQLYRFDDGWFVVDAEPEQRAWIGARVVSIGGVPVEEACQRLGPLLTRDNDWNLRLKLGGALLCGEILAGVGVVPDPSRVTLVLERDGASTTVELAASSDMHRAWGRPDLPARAGVTWLEGRERSWRLQVLEAERALYVQYNEVRAQSTDGQTLADFGSEIVRTFGEHGLERLIVDVRSNGGGDNTTFGPLIAALQTPSINRPGVLFGLIGRGTFSAAGNFVTVLERDTKAILVGEPTGGAPNQYGDARDVPLPNHPDVLVRISTRYHEFGGKSDARLTHEPRLAVPLTSQDYFAGRDPVLQAALAYKLP